MSSVVEQYGIGPIMREIEQSVIGAFSNVEKQKAYRNRMLKEESGGFSLKEEAEFYTFCLIWRVFDEMICKRQAARPDKRPQRLTPAITDKEREIGLEIQRALNGLGTTATYTNLAKTYMLMTGCCESTAKKHIRIAADNKFVKREYVKQSKGKKAHQSIRKKIYRIC